MYVCMYIYIYIYRERERERERERYRYPATRHPESKEFGDPVQERQSVVTRCIQCPQWPSTLSAWLTEPWAWPTMAFPFGKLHPFRSNVFLSQNPLCLGMFSMRIGPGNPSRASVHPSVVGERRSGSKSRFQGVHGVFRGRFVCSAWVACVVVLSTRDVWATCRFTIGLRCLKHFSRSIRTIADHNQSRPEVKRDQLSTLQSDKRTGPASGTF